MSTQPKPFLTPEEYLEIERKAEFRSEYFRGEMFAMSGAMEAHNRLVSNLSGQFYLQIRNGSCSYYSNDMRVRVSDTGLYTYPDMVVVCGELMFADATPDTLVNPILLVEVLSPSTEAYDRGFKFSLYNSIPSFQQYLLISSQYMSVELFTRQPDGKWLLTRGTRPEDEIELTSIGCRLNLADLYENVRFTRRPTPANP